MPKTKLTKNRIWMIALIFIIAGLSAMMLTAINIYTTPLIAFNEEVNLKRGVLDVFDIPFGSNEEIVDIFNEKVIIQEDDAGKDFYEYYERKKLKGVAFEIKGPGFWGNITGLVALNADLKTIKGIEILKQEETPGLGGRISEDAFKDQFIGKSVEPKITFDAITGATMTSKAFETIINENVRKFRKSYK